ncbi:MAG: hypothetical protein H7Y89_10485 [Steroidobacteraceae bacterium]|nr:hypothetical protein [Steroidobacteraceae bacterium]
MKTWMAWAIATLLASTALAADPRVGKLVRYDAGDYTIYTSRSRNQARDFIEDLFKFRITLEKTLGKRATPNQFPTHIVIVSASDFQKYFQPRENIAGYFQPGRFANYISMNGDFERQDSLHIVFHEYTHFYLASQFAGEYPPWFNEGLAELMGYVKFTNKGMAILQLPMHRVREARDGDWITFDRLIAVDNHSPEYQSHKLMSSFYSQSWLTVHYGLVENRDFGKQLFAYLRELNTLHPQPEAARTAFGPDLSSADKMLRDYSRRTDMSSGAITLGEIPPVTLPEGKPLSENDAYAVYIDLLLETRSLGPDRVRPLVEALARREPNSARSAIFEARLAALDEDNAAFTRAVDKAEKSLVDGDWEARRELGAVLLTNAAEWSPLRERSKADSELDLKRALKLYAKAVEHNNADVEALWGFGTAATRLNQNLDVAEQALVAAYQRAPSSAMIAMSLANLKSRASEPDAMIPYLKDTIRYATDLGTRRWAVETLDQMQQYIARRDEANAKYEKEVAEYEKKYGKAKKKKTK